MNFRKGTRYALYAAMEMARSTDGRPVTAGQVLGLSGQSGTGGPHLHFEVRRKRRPQDPLQYLP